MEIKKKETKEKQNKEKTKRKQRKNKEKERSSKGRPKKIGRPKEVLEVFQLCWPWLIALFPACWVYWEHSYRAKTPGDSRGSVAVSWFLLGLVLFFSVFWKSNKKKGVFSRGVLLFGWVYRLFLEPLRNF